MSLESFIPNPEEAGVPPAHEVHLADLEPKHEGTLKETLNDALQRITDVLKARESNPEGKETDTDVVDGVN